jgi:hypothetical protein
MLYCPHVAPSVYILFPIGPLRDWTAGHVTHFSPCGRLVDYIIIQQMPTLTFLSQTKATYFFTNKLIARNSFSNVIFGAVICTELLPTSPCQSGDVLGVVVQILNP